MIVFEIADGPAQPVEGNGNLWGVEGRGEGWEVVCTLEALYNNHLTLYEGHCVCTVCSEEVLSHGLHNHQ